MLDDLLKHLQYVHFFAQCSNYSTIYVLYSIFLTYRVVFKHKKKSWLILTTIRHLIRSNTFCRFINLKPEPSPYSLDLNKLNLQYSTWYYRVWELNLFLHWGYSLFLSKKNICMLLWKGFLIQYIKIESGQPAENISKFYCQIIHQFSSNSQSAVCHFSVLAWCTCMKTWNTSLSPLDISPNSYDIIHLSHDQHGLRESGWQFEAL